MLRTAWVAALVLSTSVFDAAACTLTPEFARLSAADRAKWLYEKHPVVARVTVKDISASRPHVAHVKTLESFKGPPLTRILEDFSTCGLQLQKGQDFIAFLPKDRSALSAHNMIPARDYRDVVPVLRKLKRARRP